MDAARRRPLKFAGPEIDEPTIAGVAEVLRSGHITSGPWVREFETRSRAVLRRPAGARADVGDRGGRGRAAARRHRTGRRGDHVRAELFHRAQHDRQGRRADRCSSTATWSRATSTWRKSRRRSRPRTRAIIPTHYPGALVDMDALYALAPPARLRVIEDAALVHRLALEGQQRRRVRRSGDASAFTRTRTSPPSRAARWSSTTTPKRDASRRCASTASRTLADRTRDVAFPGGKFNLPDVNARIGCAQLERLPGFLAKRRRLVDRYFARLRTDPAVRAAAAPQPTPTRTTTAGTCSACCLPLDQLTLTRTTVSRRAGRARHRHRRVVRGAAPVHAGPALRRP